MCNCGQTRSRGLTGVLGGSVVVSTADSGHRIMAFASGQLADCSAPVKSNSYSSPAMGESRSILSDSWTTHFSVPEGSCLMASIRH